MSRHSGRGSAGGERGLGPLRRLAAERGVLLAYDDATGQRRAASAEALLAVLSTLGSPVERPEDAPAALAALAAERAARRAEPVAVAWDGEGAVELTLSPEAARRGGAVEAELEVEGGRSRRWRRSLGRLPSGGVTGSGAAGAPLVDLRRLPLPGRLPFGYHRLRLDFGDSEPAEVRVIAAPRRAWHPGGDGAKPSLRDRLARRGADPAAREWGVFLPLYALRREEGDLGVGDLSGLEELGRWVGEQGGSTVATLPLLAAFLGDGTPRGGGPFEPSPYAPASRLFWNELFVDPRRLPELASSPEARRLLDSPEFAAEAARLAAGRHVDYRAAYALRRRVLGALADTFFEAAPDERRAELDALLARRPELADYAAFRAVVEARGESWHEWPEPLRSGEIPADAVDETARRFHLYAQLAAEGQLAEVGRALAGGPGSDDRGGLYLDLPLGVHPDAYDAWRHRELFAAGVSTGAPADDFFIRGQDWGFHPIHPERSSQEGHAHWIAVVRHHLAHAGWLRIDHVMQLHRLWWVPRGLAASDGAYVRYPADELTAVLTLESHRARARILGENLGTVPAYVDRALERHGIAKMFVLPFQVDRDAAAGGLHRPAGADVVASVNTHDMPTFRAWWTAADVADRLDLGLLDEAGAGEEERRRAGEREAWRRGLARSGHLAAGAGAGDDDAQAVLAAALASLGASDATLVLVNLEDLWGELAPQNTPGTSHERPNWRRRAALTLEQMRRDPRVTETLARLDRERRRGPGATPAESAAAAAAAVPAEPPAETPTARAGTMLASETGGETPVPHRITTREGTAMSERTTTLDRTDVAEVEEVAAGESLLSDDDLYLFNEGRHFQLYDKLGAHRRRLRGQDGYAFAVWAPNAEAVSVIGDFNGWDPEAHPLAARGSSGIWEGFIPGAEPGMNYKLHLRSRFGGYRVDKADPFAVRSEVPSKTGSVLWHLDYEWGDDRWMAGRRERSALDAPVSIYELHVGSWRRKPEDGDRPLTYREMAEPLADHCKELGFTHVELLPVMEHPFYGSWGYQTTGYFAPTARFGTPQDLMFLIDHLHQQGIGVILDWVPSHFPTDEHGLAYFDGTHLFEHSDPREGFHPDWGSFIFNYGRHEVRSFLISSGLYWLDRFHADGLRVDAVASMLYRDYSRKSNEWVPNVHGGRENLEAIEFLRQMNTAIYEHHPDVQTYAEESTAWPMVSRPTYVGGLGFGYKWDMGWMHDTLTYMTKDPVHRKYHQGQLTFRTVYAFSESFTMPLSHDEVVHGKGSLLDKMPGDDWQKMANLRLLYGYMWTQPGKKLLFMGGEIGQWKEWNHESSLDWHLLEYDSHRGVSRLLSDLNRLYKAQPALHELDCDPAGFEWIDASDAEHSVLSYLRRGRDPHDVLVMAFNFTPMPRPSYRIGVPGGGRWEEVLNTDAPEYGGSGQGNLGGVDASPTPLHGRSHSIAITIPPLGMVVFKGRAR